MYSLACIRDDLDYCEQELNKLKKKGKRDSNKVNEVRRLLTDNDNRIQYNIQEHKEKLEDLKGGLIDRIKRRIFYNRLYILEEYMFEVKKLQEKLQWYTNKST